MRVSLSLSTGHACYLQDVTGETELSRAVIAWLSGKRRGRLSEVYSGEEYHRIRFRASGLEALLLRGVNSATLIGAIDTHSRTRGVTIRLPSRGIW